MTEHVQPERDWQTVQGAVRLAGELAMFAESAVVRAKSGFRTFVGALLESASVVTQPWPDSQHNRRQDLQ